MALSLSSVKAERAFVSAVLASKGMVLDQCPATWEHFIDPLARGAFDALRGLYHNGQAIERATFLQRLEPAILQAAGGEFAVLDALSYVSPAAATMFFEELNDKLSLRRAADLLSWGNGELPAVKDVPGYCAELQQRAATLSAQGDADNVLSAAIDAISVKIERLRSGLGNGGIPTPIPAWNKAFGGLVNGQLYALAGRPGTGKTAMMEMMIADALSRGHVITVFEKDMSPQKLVERLACRTGDLQFHRFARGVMGKDELDTLATELKLWRTLPLKLYNPVSLTPDRMCAIARRDVRQFGSKAIFLDHVQALRVGRDMREGLTSASLSIRALTTETNVPVVVLAHINREGAEGRPRPENIKEFDQLYGDCDAMAMLWNEGSKPEELKPIRTVKFLVAKNRDGGITEDDLLFDGPNLTFKQLANEHHQRELD